MTLPRQDITDRLGIGYRRIPVLAIGNDVYCDTSLIIPVLERKFPEEKGYPTLFPQRKDSTRADTGMIKDFATFYTDRVLFPLAASLLPYKKFPASLIADRSAVSQGEDELNHWALTYCGIVARLEDGCGRYHGTPTIHQEYLKFTSGTHYYLFTI